MHWHPPVVLQEEGREEVSLAVSYAECKSAPGRMMCTVREREAAQHNRQRRVPVRQRVVLQMGHMRCCKHSSPTLTALSERPGSLLAISDHLLPSVSTSCMISSPSSGLGM